MKGQYHSLLHGVKILFFRLQFIWKISTVAVHIYVLLVEFLLEVVMGQAYKEIGEGEGNEGQWYANARNLAQDV